MKKLICILLSLTMFFAAGCGSKSASVKSEKPAAVAPGAPQTASYTMDTVNANKQPETETSQSKKIIQCQISIIVDDLYKTSNEIEKKAKELGGFVENQELNELNSYTTVRVPSSNLDGFMGFIEKSYELKNKRITSQDITEEYVDNDARLKNLKSEEAQIIEIMKKAETVEDILKVQSELYRIRGDIESLEAKKKMWDRQVDYSMVTINAEKKQIARNNKISIISGSDFGKAVSKGFKNSIIYFVLALQHLVIFIISNVIYLVIIGAAAHLAYKKFIKIKKK